MSCGCDGECCDKISVTEEAAKKTKKEKKKRKYAQTCPPGEELVGGECQKVAVTLDLEIDSALSVVEATTGKTIIEIRGIAFHDGINKNGWALTEEGARNVARQMQGSDLTLNHPDALEGGAGFDRNMDGGVNKSAVGYIHGASFHPKTNGGYEVRYIAHVLRPELFEALESGLWLRSDYGVSIGGSGVPIQADEDGIVFGEDFSFDHLAIVHKPAYENANIESIERLEMPVIEATLISHSESSETNTVEKVTAMTEEIVTEIPDNSDQIEDLKAALVLSEARCKEFTDAETAREEEARSVLVDRASEMGMSGHEDLQTTTIENLISSWEEAHPAEDPVVMEAVDDLPKGSSPITATEEPKRVVANYLNGVMVKSDEAIYSRCWNAWAKAWNGTLAGDESEMRAPMFDEIKEVL
jgi:hypothetical protein